MYSNIQNFVKIQLQNVNFLHYGAPIYCPIIATQRQQTKRWTNVCLSYTDDKPNGGLWSDTNVCQSRTDIRSLLIDTVRSHSTLDNTRMTKAT